jgi:hypothetical protein
MRQKASAGRKRATSKKPTRVFMEACILSTHLCDLAKGGVRPQLGEPGHEDYHPLEMFFVSKNQQDLAALGNATESVQWNAPLHNRPKLSERESSSAQARGPALDAKTYKECWGDDLCTRKIT